MSFEDFATNNCQYILQWGKQLTRTDYPNRFFWHALCREYAFENVKRVRFEQLCQDFDDYYRRALCNSSFSAVDLRSTFTVWVKELEQSRPTSYTGTSIYFEGNPIPRKNLKGVMAVNVMTMADFRIQLSSYGFDDFNITAGRRYDLISPRRPGLSRGPRDRLREALENGTLTSARLSDHKVVVGEKRRFFWISRSESLRLNSGKKKAPVSSSFVCSRLGIPYSREDGVAIFVSAEDPSIQDVHIPTVLNISRRNYLFRPARGNDHWGETVNSATGFKGVPEAVVAPVPWKRTFPNPQVIRNKPSARPYGLNPLRWRRLLRRSEIQLRAFLRSQSQ